MRFESLPFYAFLLGHLVLCGGAVALEPGDRPSPEVMDKVKGRIPALRKALANKNEAAVYTAVADIRECLGDFAGVPESPEKHIAPIDSSPPSLETLNVLWTKMYDEGFRTSGSHSKIARNNQMELREAAYLAIACIAASEMDEDHSSEYISRATEELDYLLVRQHSSGLFPYPAFPQGSAPANVRETVERYRRANPEAVENGYLTLNRPGSQFDTACCSYALSEGYRVTGDERYLAAANKAGLWAMEQELGTNWNYTAFSVWQLAKLSSLTRNPSYLDSAVEKTVVGVLPGLMESGRWFDQHNAKQTYHWIMVRALSELLRVMPENHPRYEEIKQKTFLAAESRAAEIVRDGASNIESTLIGLSLLLEQHGSNETIERASAVVANAMIANNGPSVIALPIYARYRNSLGRKDRAEGRAKPFGDHRGKGAVFTAEYFANTNSIEYASIAVK